MLPAVFCTVIGLRMCSSCIINGRLRQQIKGLTKGFARVFEGIGEGEGDTPSPTSKQAAGEPITPPYLQSKLSVAKRCGLWYNESAV